MAKDHTLPVRRAILTALKSDELLTSIVPASQIYPGTARNPQWPFIRYGVPSVEPMRASCVDGSILTVSVHGFAKPRYVGNDPRKAIIESAEDRAAKIGPAIAKVLGGIRIAIDGDASAYGIVNWRGSRLMRDGAEDDAWHTVQDFRVRVIS
ncbi:tail completion protein gp17 [Sphingobium sp. ba1]|uniref:tail completion protein gp17 n=1 Tax=Sphingobium sp. ba1 TaxID=1522072 RepID=UPI00097152BE